MLLTNVSTDLRGRLEAPGGCLVDWEIVNRVYRSDVLDADLCRGDPRNARPGRIDEIRPTIPRKAFSDLLESSAGLGIPGGVKFSVKRGDGRGGNFNGTVVQFYTVGPPGEGCEPCGENPNIAKHKIGTTLVFKSGKVIVTGARGGQATADRLMSILCHVLSATGVVPNPTYLDPEIVNCVIRCEFVGDSVVRLDELNAFGGVRCSFEPERFPAAIWKKPDPGRPGRNVYTAMIYTSGVFILTGMPNAEAGMDALAEICGIIIENGFLCASGGEGEHAPEPARPSFLT